MNVPTPATLFGQNSTGPAYPVLTYERGIVTRGATVVGYSTINKAGTSVPVVVVGSACLKRAILYVGDALLGGPCPNRSHRRLNGSERFCPKCGIALNREIAHKGVTRGNWAVHPDKGSLYLPLMAAQVSRTGSSTPRLLAKPEPTTDEKVIIIFRTRPGRGGTCGHYGNSRTWKCTWCSGYGVGGTKFAPDSCPECGGHIQVTSLPFPGEKLAEGRIAGNNGAVGKQIIALVPRGRIIQMRRSGDFRSARLVHYLQWNGRQLIAATDATCRLSDAY